MCTHPPACLRAPPAALAQRLSTPRGGRNKTSEEVVSQLEKASEKRDAHLQQKVERAAELRTPRGGPAIVSAPGALGIPTSS